MSIQLNIKNIKESIQKTCLIVVTKNQNINTIKKVHNLGERDFGENKVQVLIKKKKELPDDIRWHMIGHLQKNKVKLIAPFIYMIQSVDSLSLLSKINQLAMKNNRIINCLIQIKIAKEKSKYGFTLKEADELFTSNYKIEYPNINIKGIMGMATFCKNPQQIESEFKSMKKTLKLLKSKNPIFSIGMSNDYEIACHCGSNMIRIGSAIFN
jgi:pyridoxal phosphate enzyme (YggS family)